MNRTVVCIIAGLFVTMGCRREVPPSPEEQMTALRETVVALHEEGDGASGRELLKAAMVDPALLEYRGECLAQLLLSLLDDEMAAEAETAFLAAVSDPMVAQSAYGRIGAHYYNSGALPELAAWLTTLLDTPDLAGRIKQDCWRRYAAICDSAELLPSLIDRVPYLVASDVSARPAMVGAGARALLAADEPELLQAYLEAVMAGAGDDRSVVAVVQMTRLDDMLGREQLDEALALMAREDFAIADRSMVARAKRLTLGLVKATRQGDAEALLEQLIDAADEAPWTGRMAVAQWLTMARDTGDAELVLTRLGSLLERGQPLPLVFREFRETFYTVMQTADAPLREQVTAVLGRVIAHADVEQLDAVDLVMLRLDDAFYRKDFAAALALLQAGVPDKDEVWHNELINKVSAHLALSEGRTDDAIASFRQHMAVVEQWEKSRLNPADQLNMCKEVVLGFNEKRIGDILTAAGGRGAEAAAAYAKARAYYQAGLAVLAADSPEYEAAQAEMALVPVPQG